MNHLEAQIRSELFELQDKKYHEFHCKLIPTINPENVIGVRTPVLRKYAKGLSKKSQAEEYLKILPHKYYDENNLHAFLIEQIKDYETVITELNAFLPYVDNWATCDMMSPKILKEHLPELLIQIRIWLTSDHTFTIRFGIVMLMKYFLEDNFTSDYLDMVAAVKSQEYYVNMAIAWYFATALTKKYQETIPYLENQKLSAWILNKAIQKAIESYQVSLERKKYLRTLKKKLL